MQYSLHHSAVQESFWLVLLGYWLEWLMEFCLHSLQVITLCWFPFTLLHGNKAYFWILFSSGWKVWSWLGGSLQNSGGNKCSLPMIKSFLLHIPLQPSFWLFSSSQTHRKMLVLNLLLYGCINISCCSAKSRTPPYLWINLTSMMIDWTTSFITIIFVGNFFTRNS